MRNLVLVVVAAVVFMGCDPSVSVQEVTREEPPTLESAKAAAKNNGVNPKYVDFDQMYKTGQYDVYVSHPITLSGTQIDALKKRWPKETSYYFGADDTSKEVFAEPPPDQDSCFGWDTWVDPEFCECLYFPSTCLLDDPPDDSDDDYPSGGGSGGGGDDGNGDDGNGSDDGDDNDNGDSGDDDPPSECNPSIDTKFKINSGIQSYVDNGTGDVYVQASASSRVRTEGFWDTCVVTGENSKVEAEVTRVLDDGERFELIRGTEGKMSWETSLPLMVSRKRTSVVFDIVVPLQYLQKIENKSTHWGEYRKLLVGPWIQFNETTQVKETYY